MTATDIIFIAGVIFALATGLFMTHYLVTESVDAITSVPVINSSTNSSEAFQNQHKIVERFDYIVFAVFMGLILGLLITSWLLPTNIIFIVVYVFLWIFGIIGSAVLSNIWERITTTSSFAGTLAAFPIANHIMTFAPVYIAAVGFVGIVITFAKPKKIS